MFAEVEVLQKNRGMEVWSIYSYMVLLNAPLTPCHALVEIPCYIPLFHASEIQLSGNLRPSIII